MNVNADFTLKAVMDTYALAQATAHTHMVAAKKYWC